jgi:hypothetical protein
VLVETEHVQQTAFCMHRQMSLPAATVTSRRMSTASCPAASQGAVLSSQQGQQHQALMGIILALWQWTATRWEVHREQLQWLGVIMQKQPDPRRWQQQTPGTAALNALQALLLLLVVVEVVVQLQQFSRQMGMSNRHRAVGVCCAGSQET